MIALSRTRALGGSLVVTVPKDIVREEGLKPDELVQIDVERVRKSFFGIAKGIGPFTSKDEMKAHD